MPNWPIKALGGAAALGLMLGLGSACAADKGADRGRVSPLTGECVAHAAKRFKIHPDVLFAILMVEGGTVGRDSRDNSNGTYDIGPFQINSMHRKTFQSMGISEELLRDNGCVNAQAAAWHLKQTLTPEVLAKVHSEDDYLSALALYHSATPRYNKIYAEKLRTAFQRIYASDQ